MAPRPPDTRERDATTDAGEVLAGHLAALAVRFLRAVRDREADEAACAAELRAAGNRIATALDIYRPLLDPVWAAELAPELRWLGEEATHEYRCAARLARLTGALHRLTAGRGGSGAAGAARAGALLERRLTQDRARARSAALRVYGSARFHAVTDAVALLASGAPPLTAHAAAPAHVALPPLARAACRALADAADALPLDDDADAQALRGALADATGTGDPGEASWHRVRPLARAARHALEVPGAGPPPPGIPHPAALHGAGCALARHRDAAGAADDAAAAARTPRITPATAYALGVLHADQRTEAQAARHAFAVLWRPPEVTA